MTEYQTHILALDFDGVICSSVGEAAATGWKGASKLWPHRFKGNVPNDIADGFRQVRPVMETGYESILLVRLLREGCCVDEILKNSAALIFGLIRDESLEKNQLMGIFGQVRDAWMADDLQSWLKMHDFYPGIVDAVNQSGLPVYIITTKQKRFALSLCDAVDLKLPAENIWGLESGPKKHVLEMLSQKHKGACFHFLEDRLQTLIQMSRDIDIKVRLYLADWGYNTAEERRKAHEMVNIKVLSLDRFAQFVKMPATFK